MTPASASQAAAVQPAPAPAPAHAPAHADAPQPPLGVAPAATTTVSGGGGDDSRDLALNLARTYFQQGATAYEVGDFATAAAAWTHAYDLLKRDPAQQHVRSVLAFDLGQAELHAFRDDGHAPRLLVAKAYLEEFIAWVDRPGSFPTHATREDRSRASELLISIDAMLMRTAARRVATAPDPVPSRTKRRAPSKPLVVSGAVFLGLSAASAIVGGALLLQANAIVGETTSEPLVGLGAVPWYVASSAALGTAVAAAVVGTPLLATGLVRRKRERAVSQTMSMTPSGLVWSGRF